MQNREPAFDSKFIQEFRFSVQNQWESRLKSCCERLMQADELEAGVDSWSKRARSSPALP